MAGLPVGPKPFRFALKGDTIIKFLIDENRQPVSKNLTARLGVDLMVTSRVGRPQRRALTFFESEKLDEARHRGGRGMQSPTLPWRLCILL
jgi:hypothetical protein